MKNLIQGIMECNTVMSEVNDVLIRRVLTMCGFSDEMIEYLVSEGNISPYRLIDIISRAPITLDEKRILLEYLENVQNLKSETFDFIKERRRILSEANDFLVGGSDNNKLLYLFSEWYDTDELHLKSGAEGVFATTGAIEKYIENEEKGNDTDEGYYRMEVWDNTDVNRERPRYDYYYYRGKICWFEKLGPKIQEQGNTYYMTDDREFAAGRLDLNLRTIYKPGDIVLIDCRPFGPHFHAMILEARDQYDCCFPNIVFQYPGTNEWSLTPLKHRRLFKDIEWQTYEPVLSPLYRLKKIKDDEITEKDARLLKLSSIISGSEENAGKIWRNWCSPERDDILSWDQVLEVFESVIK